MFNKTQLLNDLANKLAQETPDWYSAIVSACASQYNGHQDCQLIRHYQHVFDPYVDYIESRLLNEDSFLSCICDIIRGNFYQAFSFAYLRMQPNKVEVPFDGVEEKLDCALAQCPKSPIIVSFGVDMFGLGKINGLVYDEKSRVWIYKGIKIIEIPTCPFTREINRSFVVLSQEDAPFVDFSKKRYISLWIDAEEAQLTSDVHQTWEVFPLWLKDEIGNVTHYFRVFNQIPILCKRGVHFSQIKVKEYDFERELGRILE